MGKRFIKAWHEGKSDTDTFEFESPKALFTILTLKRWELIERLQALGEVSSGALAHSIEREVKRVHEDAAVLLDWGLIERTAGGKLHVPYEKIHTEFDLLVAAYAASRSAFTNEQFCQSAIDGIAIPTERFIYQ